MADLDLVATGIEGLDPLFFGGIRRGNVVLVKGEPGSGKTILGTEFIYRGATRYGEPGLIVVFESNPIFLRRDAASFGWDLHALEQQNTVKIIATSPQVLNQELRAANGVLLETAREMGARRSSRSRWVRTVPSLPTQIPKTPGHGGHGFRTSVIHAVAAAQRLFRRTREGL